MGLFDLFRCRLRPASIRKIAGSGNREDAPDGRGILKVTFDPRQVTGVVMHDMQTAIAGLRDFQTQQQARLFDVAIGSVQQGPDPDRLAIALVAADIPGVDVAKAASIARYLNNRATALMERYAHIEMGITQARWLHSGAACFQGMDGQEDIADGHRFAKGQIYKVEEGLMIHGVPTWPGAEEGCNCAAIPIAPGYLS